MEMPQSYFLFCIFEGVVLSRALSDNSRLIVSDAVEVPVDLRSSFSKLISPAMYRGGEEHT